MCIRDRYSINGGAWTGCPVGDPTVTITAGGVTTVTARVVDGAGNASGQTATAKVYIDPASPNVPGITLSTEQWTNSTVTAAIKDNGDAHSGVARTEYSLDGGSWTTYSGVLSIEAHGKHTVSVRAIDNVGRISGTASKTALVDKVAPVISRVEQQPNSGHTEMTLAVTATDADSGVSVLKKDRLGNRNYILKTTALKKGNADPEDYYRSPRQRPVRRS